MNADFWSSHKETIMAVIEDMEKHLFYMEEDHPDRSDTIRQLQERYAELEAMDHKQR